MKFLVFGLGNPGEQYTDTRHNIGFNVVNALVKDEPWHSDRFGLKCEIKHKGRNIIAFKPDTYMNLSGKAVKFWMKKENCNPEQILIIADELVLPLGTLRLKGKGSDAGHNGHKSIIEELGHSNYPRLRFGIGNNFEQGKQVNFVLGKWNLEEKEKVNQGIEKSVETIKLFAFNGITTAMNFANTANV